MLFVWFHYISHFDWLVFSLEILALRRMRISLNMFHFIKIVDIYYLFVLYYFKQASHGSLVLGLFSQSSESLDSGLSGLGRSG